MLALLLSMGSSIIIYADTDSILGDADIYLIQDEISDYEYEFEKHERIEKLIINPFGFATSVTCADSLIDAINDAGSEQTAIMLVGNIEVTDSIVIPFDRDIILLDPLGDASLYASDGNFPIVVIDGTLTLDGPAITRTGLNRGTETRGVRVNSNGNFIMESGVIENHATEAINPGAEVGRGGGVFVNGGSFVMNGGYIRNNEAIRSFASGGGVFINNGTFIMSGGTISDNRAWGSTTGIGGGGVAIFNNSSFDMFDGYIKDNNSGIYEPGVVYQNTGGGISIGASSNFTLHSGNIIGNWANGRGGGVYTHWSIAGGTGYMGMNNHFVMHGGIISDNTAFRSNPGVVGVGGGVYIGNNTSTFIMHGGIIGPNNQAFFEGGGIYSRNAEVIIHTNGVILGNRAGHSGGGIQLSSVAAHASGGTPVREVSLLGGRIIDNEAVFGGGGVNVDGRTFNMYGGEISGNEAFGAGTGGGVNLIASANLVPATFIMHDGIVSENIAAHGGGISANQSTVFIHDGEITNNIAVGDGGGVRGVSSTIIMEDGEIAGNNATNGIGGGVYVSATANQISTFTMNGGLISDNRALNPVGGFGGGVGIANNGVFNINNDAIIYDNEAQRGGGVAVVFASSEFVMAGNAVIYNNTANEFGGGVYTRGLAKMHGGEIKDNAANYGGGVYVAMGTATANGRFIADGQSYIIGNIAKYDGGGIFTANYSYQDPLPLAGEYTNLLIANTVVFENNSAQAGFRPPSNVITLLNIEFASISLFNHPLNNFDINFRGFRVLEFHPNGGVFTGDSQLPYRLIPSEATNYVDAFNATDNLVNPDLPRPMRSNHTFGGWFNSEAEANNLALQEGRVLYSDEVANLPTRTLWARWIPQGGGWRPPPGTPIELEPPDVPIGELSPHHYAYLIGYPDGFVRPGNNITRAEVSTIFFRLISDEHRINVWSQSNPFPDVIIQNWFNNAISTLTNADILYGYPDGYFRPNQSMTRAEFAAVIVRIMGERGAMNMATHSFIDVSGHWGEEYISVAYMLGWVQGYGDGTFRPNQPITRAEVAALVNRALQRRPEYCDDLLPDMIKWPDNMDPDVWYYLYIQEATNSHYHEMKADGIHETWTALIAPREWWRLERPDSDPRIFTGANIGEGMGIAE